MKTPIIPRSAYVAVASAGTPVPLVTYSALAKTFLERGTLIVIARKSKTVANTGNVYLGSFNAQELVLVPGQSFAFEATPERQIDMGQIYIDAATSADGVVWIWVEGDAKLSDAVASSAAGAGTSTLTAGELHIGEVSTPADVIQVIPTVDTNIYASGDTLFDTTAIANGVRVSGGQAILQSLSIIDKADQTAAAMTLYFFNTATSCAFGTINSAPSITDANALKFLGSVTIDAADWVDLGGVKVASKRGLGLVLESANVREIGVAATVAGTPTYAAATDLVLNLGFLW